MIGLYKRWKYQQDVLGALYSILYLYPDGVKRILVDYPGVKPSIQTYREDGATADKAAVFIAADLLTNIIGAMDAEGRERISRESASLDLGHFKRAVRELMAGKGTALPDAAYGTLMIAMALVVLELQLHDGKIDQDVHNMFISEVAGALQGKSSAEHSAEWITEIFDRSLGAPNVTRAGENDHTAIIGPQQHAVAPRFSGSQTSVRLVRTLTGIALVRIEDGQQVTERRALKQEDLDKVPMDASPCTFVNVQTRSGELRSCIIAGEESEVYGSNRAFWWALARVNVVNTDRIANGRPMSQLALATAHVSARTMWDIAVQKAGSIDDLRDTFVPLKNMHFEAIGSLIDRAENDAAKLGLEVARAMVLATQSEDELLEAFAFSRFKRFLWQPGEEPSEFYGHN